MRSWMLSNCNCARHDERSRKKYSPCTRLGCFAEKRENEKMCPTKGLNFGKKAMPTSDRNTQHARDNNGNMKSFGQTWVHVWHKQTVLTAKTPFYQNFFTSSSSLLLSRSFVIIHSIHFNLIISADWWMKIHIISFQCSM